MKIIKILIKMSFS